MDRSTHSSEKVKVKFTEEFMKQPMNDLCDKYKCFHAFNESQFEEGLKKYNLKDEDVTCYEDLHMFCIPNNIDTNIICEKMNEIYLNAVKQKIDEYTVEKILIHEFEMTQCFSDGYIPEKFFSNPDITELNVSREFIIELFNIEIKKAGFSLAPLNIRIELELGRY